MGHTLPIIVLAAGASRRMRGRDKLLEDIDGIPLLRHQVLKARSVTDGTVIVALPPAPHARYDVLKGMDVQIVPVMDADTGMNASLRAAFAMLPSDAMAAMVLLGDLPDVTASDLSLVAHAVDLKSDTLIWRGATQDGAPGHPIIFHADLFDAFADLTGDTGGREVVAKAKDRVCLVQLADDRARRDLDTPEEWAAWRASRGSSRN